MEKIPPQYEENIKAALQGLKRREKDIVQLMETAVLGLAKPESVKVELIAHVQDRSVWVDEERIIKTFANLLVNAVEAMPGGGECTVRLEDSEKQVTITIQDTGTGISRENMDNLLTPFFTTKPAGEGTGLGLPFAYGAVKLHDGKFSIESNADPSSGPTGTRITIVLPRAKPELSKVIIDSD